jgi:hypothetical protein
MKPVALRHGSTITPPSLGHVSCIHSISLTLTKSGLKHTLASRAECARVGAVRPLVDCDRRSAVIDLPEVYSNLPPRGSHGGARPMSSTQDLPTFPGIESVKDLTNMSSRGRSCRLCGFLVREDDQAIYISDPHGTWMLPHDSYESRESWKGGESASESTLTEGKPVQVVLKEGSQIYEIRSWTIRKGGDPIEAKLRREVIQRIFTLDAGELPITERTKLGERQLAALEEMMGRRLGWDPDKDIYEQVFSGHHPRSASWSCGSDGGGS